MIGHTISHYKILEKLGEGGMGVVYKAQDLTLDRFVALKFLPHFVAADETEKARFLQEAKAAATLNHPNVCTIHAIEEADRPAYAEASAGPDVIGAGKQQFIVMEYVDGKMLREVIQSKIPNPQSAISYAIQIGEALQEAHSKGIVHRDIKADNIMINTKNQVKVMDFGLAKLKGSLKLTRSSSTVGTLAYMAPEQIQGGEVDARSDIFSFGVVLYEMLTGRTPFRGEHEAAMMYSILNEEPEPIEKHRSDAPAELKHIIARALEKEPEDRYQHVDDMVSELRRLKKQSAKVSRPSMSSMSTVPSGEVLEAMKPQLASRISRPSKKTLWIGIVSATLILVAATVYFLLPIRLAGPPEPQVSRKMLVVLPFENLGSPEQEYFADGITEEITSKLSGLSGLGIIAHSSALQYKKTAKPIKQIGEELGVSYILQGTIRWEDADGTKRVRVNPQLVNVADGTQIWSQPSEAVLASAFKLQSEIAAQVASALNVSLLQQEKQSLEAKLTDNSEAYDYYLRGHDYYERSQDKRDLEIAQEMFKRAIELDPKFASAYARLSRVHTSMFWFYYDHTEARVLQARENAQKTLQLSPDLSLAHWAMAWYYYQGKLDYENALKEFSLVLKYEPNNSEIYSGIAAVRRRQGKTEDAVTNFRKAVEIDPRSHTRLLELAETYVLLRQYTEAERYIDRALMLSPDWGTIYTWKSWTYLLAGNIVKARVVMSEAKQRKIDLSNAEMPYIPSFIDACEGKYQDALDWLAGSPVKLWDYQFEFTPKELQQARINGYMNHPSLARAYYDSARILVEREVRKQPDDPRLHSALGIAYAGIGRKEDAIREGKRGAELLPVSKEAWRGAYRVLNLAQIYVMVGEYDQAIDLLQQLLSMPFEVSVQLLRIDPFWTPLRDHPRFMKLVAEGK